MSLPMNFDNHVSTPTEGKASNFREAGVLDNQPGLTQGQGPEDRSVTKMIPSDKPPFGKQLSPA